MVLGNMSYVPSIDMKILPCRAIDERRVTTKTKKKKYIPLNRKLDRSVGTVENLMSDKLYKVAIISADQDRIGVR